MNIKGLLLLLCFLLFSLVFKSQGLFVQNPPTIWLSSNWSNLSREKDINSLHKTEAEHTSSSDVISLDKPACLSCHFWGNKTDDPPAQSELSPPRGPVPFSAKILWAALGFTSIKRKGPVHWGIKVSTIFTIVMEFQPTPMKVKPLTILPSNLQVSLTRKSLECPFSLRRLEESSPRSPGHQLASGQG